MAQETKPEAPVGRRERLQAALRANLRRRKEQSRSRATQASPVSEDPRCAADTGEDEPR